MAVTVTSQLTTLSSCESTTGWTVFNISGTMGTLGAIQASDEEMPPREGTYCLGWDQDVENGGYYYGLTSAYRSLQHVYIWAASFTAGTLAVSNPGSGQSGVYIYARDSSGNAGYWHVGGSDTYKGGWKCFTAYLGNAPDTNSGTAPNMGQCTGIGIGFNHAGKSKATHNMFIDFLRVATTPGYGLQVSTTSGSVATWEDIYTNDDSQAIGVCRKEGGVYFLQGGVSFGDGSSLSCEFEDFGQVVVFEDAKVKADHYQLNINSYSSGTHNFTLGTKVGGQGIRGGSIIGLLPWQLNCYSSYIDTYQFYGANIVNASVTFGTRDGTTPENREVVSCSFTQCAIIDSDTTPMQYCNIIEADSIGVYYNQYMTDCNIINCPVGIQYTTAGEYDCNGLKFYGNVYDVQNAGFATFMDSNPTTNYSTGTGLNSSLIHAQTFTADGGDITYVAFYLAGQVGTGTGYVEAYLYDTSGGVPTGSPLVTFSQATHAVVKLIGNSWYTIIGFGIDTAYTTTSSHVYAVAIKSVNHDGSNYLTLGLSSNTAHSGSYYYYSASWTLSGSSDLLFYVGKNDALTLNKTNEANPTTSLPDGTAIVNIRASITLEMVVTDEDGDVVVGAYAYIDDNDTTPFILNTTTNSSGIASTSYVGAAVVGSRWRVRKYGYKPYRQLVDVGSTSISLPVTLIADPQQT
jgi:hypothetical protein